MYNEPRLTKPEVLAELKNRGIAKVAIDFSGGNDEGGPESTVATRADGEAVALPERAYVGFTLNRDTRQWEAAREFEGQAARDQALMVALEGPIHDHWGGFAGEFSVQGTLTWTTATGEAKLVYSESVQHYEDHEEVL
jgi:hypothetical protein